MNHFVSEYVHKVPARFNDEEDSKPKKNGDDTEEILKVINLQLAYTVQLTTCPVII